MASEPHRRISETVSANPPRIYLLDVEGTTSPVSLVYEQLFPYARKYLLAFLNSHVKESEIQQDLELLQRELAAQEAGEYPNRELSLLNVAQAAEYLEWLMDQDRKSTALKSLQGKIWKSGYLAGELQGTVFPDVAAAFARWSSQARIAIYSSGSAEAQQLLFRYSSAGDLTPYISAYFDTRTGPKTSPDSYRAIAVALGVSSSQILFVSDLSRELDPAHEAGCQTRLSVREGNHPVLNAHSYHVIRSFSDIA